MYKIQFLNAYTQEILREESYEKPDHIESMIEGLKNAAGEIYLFDDKKRTLVANYVSDKIVITDFNIIYKVYFKVKLSPIQAKIKS